MQVSGWAYTRALGAVSQAVVLAVSLTLVPAANAQSSTRYWMPPAPRPSDIDQSRAVATYLQRASAFGVAGAILIADHGQVVLRSGYGLADRSAPIGIAPETPFLVGSLSKQFTATAILRLEMEGRLRTTDSIGKWLPDIPSDKAGITVNELLTHTSGLPYLPPGNFFDSASRAQVFHDVLALPLQSTPGAQYAYSTPGYNLLGAIIERVSGESYETYLGQLFRRAGMTHTGFVGALGAMPGAKRIHSYTDDVDEGSLADVPAVPRAVGAGTVVTTLDDFYSWLTAIRRNKLLDARATAKLLTPAVPERPSIWATAGWNLSVTTGGDTVMFTAGDLGGYNAEWHWNRTRDILVIFFSNTRPRLDGLREAVMPHVMALLIGLEHDLPPRVGHYDRVGAGRDTGVFVLPSGSQISVRPGTAGLDVMRDGQDAFTWLAGARLADTSLATITVRAQALTAALQRGDTIGLGTSLQARPMAASAVAAAVATWHAMTDSLGAVAAVRPVGTAVGSGLDARTEIHVTYARGEQTLILGWRNGQLASTTMQDSGESIQFLPEKARRDAYVSYDVFTGRTVRLVFSSGDGQSPALRIESGDTAITAEGKRGPAVQH